MAAEDKDKKPIPLPPAWVGDAINTTGHVLNTVQTFYPKQTGSETSAARSADGSRQTSSRHSSPSSGSSVTQTSKSSLSKGVKAVKKGGTVAGLVGAGGVLVCDVLGSVMKENDVDVGKPVDQDLVQAILEHCKKKEQYKEAVDKLLNFCASAHAVDLPGSAGVKLTWMQLRDRSVSELRKLAKNIDEHHKNVNITTVTTASVGTVAGAVTLATIFAPFTFGLSYAVGAAAVGATAGLTALGASLTEMGLTKSTCSTAQEYIDADGKLTTILYSLLDELNKCAEELKLSAEKLDSWSGLEIARTVFVGIGGLGNVVSSSTSLARGAMMMNPGVRSLAKEMAKIPKADWVAKFGSKGRSFSAAKGLAKQTPSLAGKGARAFGGVLAGVGLVLDVYTIVTTSIDLAKGSVSEAGTALREKAGLLEKERNEITDLIEELKKSRED